MNGQEPLRRAQIVGLGLIGGSVGCALRERGWWVTGSDRDASHETAALKRGAISEVGCDTTAELCVVAVPVGEISRVVNELSALADWVITDVGSVKRPVVEAVSSTRFVPGHPMAGSEQDGVAASNGSMFHGAVWALTPSAQTEEQALALVHSVVASFGAEVVTIDPLAHDQVVAMVSHVPHLTAATLMSLASERAVSQTSLLRLAAGGFRDMTRIAAGSPSIWPDICGENRVAIVEVLEALIEDLAEVRDLVAANNRSGLTSRLEGARQARRNLPTTVQRPGDLIECRIGVPDRPGVLAQVTALATSLDVNIYDIEIAHSAEGPQGVLILVLDGGRASRFMSALSAEGFSVASRELG